MRLVKPKKFLGQHFLKDLKVAQDIADTVDDCPNLPILEVGPGMGVLTQFLLPKERTVKVVEVDYESVAYLREAYPQLEDNIIEDDYLKMNLQRLFDGQPFVLTGNYPYNISSQIFFKMLYNKELIQQLINTLIVIVTRNIAKYLPEKIDERSEEKTLDILQYIQNNIYNPDKIKADTISQHFGISQNYLGRYFKKHTNETMQQYIIKYKLKLVENRLLHSEMRINEIAAELGFTDESPLNKLFIKYKGVIPSEFRKRNL